MTARRGDLAPASNESLLFFFECPKAQLNDQKMQLNANNYAKFTNVCTFRVNDCRFVQMNVYSFY